MKLCPQCEFIYEDDQRLCDMDGAALVYDPKPFPAAKDPAISSANSQRWRFATTVVLGVVLGTLLVFQLSVSPAAKPGSRNSATQMSNNPAGQGNTDSDSPSIDDSESPSNLDLTQPVPLTPPIDATRALSPNVSRKASPGFESAVPSQSIQSPRLSSSAAKANGSATAPVNLSPTVMPPVKRVDVKRKRAAAMDKPKAAHQKKDSSIGSFLKKTGHILKKPFKL